MKLVYDARMWCAIDNTITDTSACDIVASMLDYCSAPFAGMSETNLNKSQRTKNNLARMITSTGRLKHIKPVLMELHRLPISFKMAKLIHSVSTSHQPSYLVDLIDYYLYYYYWSSVWWKHKSTVERHHCCTAQIDLQWSQHVQRLVNQSALFECF